MLVVIFVIKMFVLLKTCMVNVIYVVDLALTYFLLKIKSGKKFNYSFTELPTISQLKLCVLKMTLIFYLVLMILPTN